MIKVNNLYTFTVGKDIGSGTYGANNLIASKQNKITIRRYDDNANDILIHIKRLPKDAIIRFSTPKGKVSFKVLKHKIIKINDIDWILFEVAYQKKDSTRLLKFNQNDVLTLEIEGFAKKKIKNKTTPDNKKPDVIEQYAETEIVQEKLDISYKYDKQGNTILIINGKEIPIKKGKDGKDGKSSSKGATAGISIAPSNTDLDPAVIKERYESNFDTNAYTDDEKRVLAELAQNAFGSGVIDARSETFDGGVSTITLFQIPYDIDSVQVFLYGVYVPSTNCWSISDRVITFNTEIPAGTDIVTVKYFVGEIEISKDYFTGDGSTTEFILSETVNNIQDLFIFVSGVSLSPQDCVTFDDKTITFNTAPPSVSIEIINVQT